MKRYELYRSERDAGLSISDIARKHGVSKQAVSQAVSKYCPNQSRPMTRTTCIYPGLRKWMNDEKVGISELLRRIGICPYPANGKVIRQYLNGDRTLTKPVIDKIITATGLTYEALFAEV